MQGRRYSDKASIYTTVLVGGKLFMLELKVLFVDVFE